jgi:malonyl-CoA/methylmalonyl-CoA synthetase
VIAASDVAVVCHATDQALGCGQAETSMKGSEMRIHDSFERWLRDDPQREFLHLPHRTVRFAELGRMVDAAQTELLAGGVRVGDRVLVVAENCPEHVALLVACSRVGAWSCGVNARMAPAEVDALMAAADARVTCFTTEASPAAAAHAQRQGAAASALPGLQRTATRWEARAEPEPLASQVGAVIFTSGTTGAPKGVMMTHDGVLHFARVSAASRALGPNDRSYAFVPMTHLFGLGTVLLASLQVGAALVMRHQFDPDDLLDALAHRGVSQLQGPPALFSRLLAHLEARGITKPPAPHLRYVYTGAAPLDLALKRRVEDVFGLPLHHGYGLSEYAGGLHLTSLGPARQDTSAGYLVEGAEVRIADPEGRGLPPGQRGEIWVRGRGLMPGYFRDAEATTACMREGGWYATGDLGEMAADGALFVVGRLKEMIIRSGFNVYPAEVEAVLGAFDAVQRSAVLGRKESGGNEEIVAFVELRPGHTLDRPRLDQFIREHLAPYKRPGHIEIVDALPLGNSGKVLKRELLSRLEETIRGA